LVNNRNVDTSAVSVLDHIKVAIAYRLAVEILLSS